jgi:hypothetical protein
MSGERSREFDTVLDWLAIIAAVGSLIMVAYDLNVVSLGRRLAAETQSWLKEQTWRAPAPPPQKEDPPS